MNPAIPTAIISIVVIMLILAFLVARARRNYAAEVAPMISEEPAEDRSAEHRLLDEKGTELIERRVNLDARRGTLGGDANLLEQLDELTVRHNLGEISDDEYEAEKVRLLGG